MAYMRFRGEAGQELYDRVADCRDWLASSLVVGGLRGEERRRAEEELIAFLLNARFDHSILPEMGFADQLDYVRRVHSWNPDSFKLLRGREPLTVDVETTGGVVQLPLGYARGVSFVLPVNARGYEDYFYGRIWSLQFGPHHVLPRSEVPANPCYVYLGTLFDFYAMPRLLAKQGKHDGLVVSVGTPKSSLSLMRQLFRHAGRFFPKIHKSDHGDRYFTAGDDPENLPTFFCATDREFGDELLCESAFKLEGINIIARPLYQLRVADVNNEAIDPKRREAIGDLIEIFWESCK